MLLRCLEFMQLHHNEQVQVFEPGQDYEVEDGALALRLLTDHGDRFAVPDAGEAKASEPTVIPDGDLSAEDIDAALASAVEQKANDEAAPDEQKANDEAAPDEEPSPIGHHTYVAGAQAVEAQAKADEQHAPRRRGRR